MNYEKNEVMPTKGFTKYLLNKYNILNGARYFSSNVLKNFLVFIATKNILDFLVAKMIFICGYLMECQKNVLKI